MVKDINKLLEYFENLVFEASPAFGFIQKSLLVFEWYPFEKKDPKMDFQYRVKMVNFQYFWEFEKMHEFERL